MEEEHILVVVVIVVRGPGLETVANVPQVFMSGTVAPACRVVVCLIRKIRAIVSKAVRAAKLIMRIGMVRHVIVPVEHIIQYLLIPVARMDRR